MGDRGYNFNDKMSNVGIKKIKDYVIEQKVTIYCRELLLVTQFYAFVSKDYVMDSLSPF